MKHNATIQVVFFILASCLVFLTLTPVFSQADSSIYTENNNNAEIPRTSAKIVRVDSWKEAIRPDYKKIDDYVRQCGPNCGKTPEEVAEKVTANCETDLEKARAIYDWLAFNISYDTTYSTYSAEAAFKKRVSVCNGYAQLFERMGRHIGINAIFTSGDAKNNLRYKPNGSLGTSGGHAWNIVFLEDRAILIDATWGAGYVNGSRFTREFDEYWFDVHPAMAIFTHFPDSYFHQLLEPCISYSIFKELPYLTPLVSYSGIDPAETLKYFLEHPEAKPIICYGTLDDVVSQGVKFVTYPLSSELVIGEEYEIRFYETDKANLKCNIAEKVINDDGSCSFFLKSDSARKAYIQSSVTGNMFVLDYYFVNKRTIYSKHKVYNTCMPRVALPVKSVQITNNCIQTGSNLLDCFFIVNTELIQKNLQDFTNNAVNYFFDKNQYTQLMGKSNGTYQASIQSDFTIEQCVAYCNYLSDKEGFQKCYSFDEIGNIVIDKSADGYRIPTLNEWMYAATNGTMIFPSTPEELAENAWFYWNCLGSIHCAANNKPNAFGLYDMFGNVKEIVFDEENNEYYAIGGSASDDYETISALKKIPANDKGILNGTIRPVRIVPDNALAITKQGNNFLVGGIMKENLEAAFKWFTLGYQKGCVEAANYLGYMYSHGKYVEKNDEAAFKYFLEAAEKGNVTAIYNIGLSYDNGLGVAKDAQKAFEWYTKAADAGNTSAMYTLAKLYNDEKSPFYDVKKYFAYLNKAVENGYNENNVFMEIALCYENAYGTDQNLSLAFNYYSKSVKDGNHLALKPLGDCYRLGKGVTISYYKAQDLYKEAEEKGYPEASVELSKMYYKGQYYALNIANALKKMEKARENGFIGEEDYYNSLVSTQSQLLKYGTDSKYLLKSMPKNVDTAEYFASFANIDTLATSISGAEINNPFIYNGLTTEQLQSKVINFMQLASDQKEFPIGTKVLLLILPKNWSKSHAVVQKACKENVLASLKSQMNRDYYRFDESFLGYYDAVIPILSEKLSDTLKNLEHSLYTAERTDILSLDCRLFVDISKKNVKIPYYQISLHDLWKKQIDEGILPRLVLFGDKTDSTQYLINNIFASDGDTYAEKINVFGTPLAMTDQIAIGFRKRGLMIFTLTKVFATKKAFRLYLDESGVKQGKVTQAPSFIPVASHLAEMKNGKYDTISCIAKPGKMVMDYAVVKPR